jgi:5'-methylthioadenosine phosphorylase
LEKAEIAIVGGTGFKELFKGAKPRRIRTPYGLTSPLLTGELDHRMVIFLQRHDLNHSVPPHKINYRANICGLHRAGIERILATNAVGAINRDLKPGDIVVPHDFIDFTKLRPTSFYDEAPVTHIDVSQPYCPEIRALLIDNARKHGPHVRSRGVMACSEGPRFETPAEIEMYRRLGCDIVGMTGATEAVLARELEMCYATICYVSNMAAGIQDRLTASEVSKVFEEVWPPVERILIDSVKALPLERGPNCICAAALENARFE